MARKTRLQARLSRPFLGTRDLFFYSKVITETLSKTLSYEEAARSDLRLVRCVQRSLQLAVNSLHAVQSTLTSAHALPHRRAWTYPKATTSGSAGPYSACMCGDVCMSRDGGFQAVRAAGKK